MPSNDNFTVNLRQIERETAHLDLTLDRDFFQRFDHHDIIDGQAKAKVAVRFGSADTFTFSYQVEGVVEVSCDRCLDPVRIPFEVDEQVKVAYDDEDKAASDGELILVPYSQLNYDFAWDLLELILLELPLQRVHPDGECNPEMLSRFSIEQDSDEDEDEA
ncbi:MAG: DUF177 domain-containing protein, partial [Bacteroidaceae bacterium]|nr:DUF177 domain-containing protein [Bacteroidaceae bacterium]